MKILLDTNVIFDVWSQRQPFYGDSSKVLNGVYHGLLEGFVAPITIATAYYLIRKVADDAKARSLVGQLLAHTTMVHASTADFRRALNSQIRDFEDAILAVSAHKSRLDFVITRDLADFAQSPVPAISPTDFLKKNP